MADETLEVLIRMRGGRVAAAEVRGVTTQVEGLTRATERQSLASKAAAGTANATRRAWSGMVVPALKIGGGLAALTAAGTAWVGLNFDSTMEQNTVSFTHFLGSTKAAHKYLDQLYNLAATTPFEFKDVAVATKQMLAFGFGAQESISNLRTIGDAASGLGTGTEGINRMVLALGQMKVAGVVQGDELRQFQEAGINVYKYMEDAGLITKADIGQIGQMHIDAGKAIHSIMVGMQKDFGGLSANQAKTWQGQLSTMKDYASQAAGALVQPLFDLGRSRVLPSINRTLQGVAKWARGGGVKRAGRGLQAGFQARDMTAVQGFSGTEGLAAKAGVRLGQGWHLAKLAFAEAKPVLEDLWGILRQTWQTVRPFVPVVAVGLYLAFKALAGVVHFVNANFDLLLAIMRPLAAAFLAYKTVTGAIALATKVWTTAQLILNAVMTANPIGLVIAGVALLLVGFITLYQKVGWFRRAVQAVWGWLKSNWPTLVAILAGPIGIAVLLVIRHWDKLKGAARSVVSWVKNAFNDVVHFFSAMPGRISRAASGMWDGIKDSFRSAVNWVIQKWNNLSFGMNAKKVAGHTVIPGFHVGTPNIPLLAEGGSIAARGAAVVGDKGPELLDLPAGARVTPLDGGGGGKVREVVRLVTVDGRVLAEAVFGAAETARARA